MSPTRASRAGVRSRSAFTEPLAISSSASTVLIGVVSVRSPSRALSWPHKSDDSREAPMSTAHELLDDLTGAGRQLREKIPGVYAGYAKMSAAAMGEEDRKSTRLNSSHEWI